jgi:hypothetical protein
MRPPKPDARGQKPEARGRKRTVMACKLSYAPSVGCHKPPLQFALSPKFSLQKAKTLLLNFPLDFAGVYVIIKIIPKYFYEKIAR